MISKLPASVSQQVCASQVIVDLSSCIKELIENSIDAGSTFIRVTLENYGKAAIEVFDNGSGITRSNLGRICEKGATSKLTGWGDVHNVETLGFRGEALNALRNIGILEIETKTELEDPGVSVILSEGQGINDKTVPYKHGTRISVKSLFHNIPVRQKHWHSHSRQQMLKVCQLLREYSLSYLQVQFMMISKVQGKTECMFESAINTECLDSKEKWLRRIEIVLGKGIADSLQYIEDTHVQGWVSKQLLGKSNTQTTIKRNMLYMYVNRRPVDFLRSLQKSIEELYKEWNSFNKFLVIINIKLSSNSADISSTPDKRHLFTKLQTIIVEEVKRKITELMQRLYFRPKKMEVEMQTKIKGTERRSEGAKLTERCFEKTDTVEEVKLNRSDPKVGGDLKQRFKAFRGIAGNTKDEIKPDFNRRISDNTNLRINRLSLDSVSEVKQQKIDTIKTDSTPQNAKPDNIAQQSELEKIESLRLLEKQISGDVEFLQPPTNFQKYDFREVDILGQFNRGFIVCYYRGEFYVVDQHAASEKTNFQQLLAQPPTRVHLPKTIKVTPEDMTFIEENLDSLVKFGYEFQICEQTSNTIVFSSFPRLLGCTFNEKSFVELARNSHELKRPDRHPIVTKQAAMTACHMSIRVGDILRYKQMKELLEGLCELESPWNCPHGRPTIVKLSDITESLKNMQLQKSYTI